MSDVTRWSTPKAEEPASRKRADNPLRKVAISANRRMGGSTRSRSDLRFEASADGERIALIEPGRFGRHVCFVAPGLLDRLGTAGLTAEMAKLLFTTACEHASRGEATGARMARLVRSESNATDRRSPT